MTGGYFKPLAAAVGAIGLAVSGVCLSVPLDRCLGPVGNASAAPSPTCASDLRECLRVSARTGLYGVRYVTAEDVARCMEAFRACNSGTLQGNPNAPTKGLPQRFKITGNENTADCTVNGVSIACTLGWKTPDWVDAYSGKFTGTVSGMTATGTSTQHIEGHSPPEPSCTHVEDYTGPATYVFSPDGTVTARVGPNQRQTRGICNGNQFSNSGVTEAAEVTGTWIATK